MIDEQETEDQKTRRYRTFVDKHVKEGQTALIDNLLKLSGQISFRRYDVDLPEWEEIQNYERQLYDDDLRDENPDLWEQFQEDIEAIDVDDIDEKFREFVRDEGGILFDESAEIMSWFLVTDWLGRRLLEKGEAILEYDDSYWWGRRTYGAGIYDDSVIQEIADALR